MVIESILVGLPKIVEYKGRQVTTGIFKEKVHGPVRLFSENLAGDGQADLTVHGGRDKALYAYAKDAYLDWQRIRPQDQFPDGAMGENLTFRVLPENELCVGDIFSLGQAKVQVAQPRFPCEKLGVKFKDLLILKQFIKLARPGVYFRVLEEGLIEAGDELIPIFKHPVKATILELFAFKFGKPMTDARKREILAIDGLPDYWQAKLV